MGLFPLHLFETNDIVVNRPPGVDLVPAIPMATLNVTANQHKNLDFWGNNS